MAYRAAFLLMRAWSLTTHPHLRGVKCVFRDAEGSVLWVRHTYGDRSVWELPGGAARRSESAPAAARREAHEELGHHCSQLGVQPRAARNSRMASRAVGG